MDHSIVPSYFHNERKYSKDGEQCWEVFSCDTRNRPANNWKTLKTKRVWKVSVISIHMSNITRLPKTYVTYKAIPRDSRLYKQRDIHLTDVINSWCNQQRHRWGLNNRLRTHHETFNHAVSLTESKIKPRWNYIRLKMSLMLLWQLNHNKKYPFCKSFVWDKTGRDAASLSPLYSLSNKLSKSIIIM